LLFSGGAFIQSLFREHGRDIIHMETVAQVSTRRELDGCRHAAVAVVVTRDSIVEDTGRDDFAAFADAHDFVTILCFSAISVVHNLISSY